MAANDKKTIAELQRQLNQIQASTNLNDKEKESAAKRIAQAIKEQRIETELLVKSSKDYDDVLGSIGSSYGKNNKLFKESEKILSHAKMQVDGMVALSDKLGKSNKQYKGDILEVAKGYKQVNSSILTSLDNVIKTGKGEKEIAKAVEKQVKSHGVLISKIDVQTKSGKAYKKLLESQVEQMNNLGKAATAAAKDIEKMHKGSEALSESSLGGKINEFLKLNKMMGGKTGSIGDLAKNMATNRASKIGGATNIPAPGTKGNPVMSGGKQLFGAAAQSALKSGSGTASIAAETAGGAGGLISSLGSMMAIVAPILAIVGLIYMAFEFWNSGGLAKTMASAKMLTGNKMLGKQGVKEMRKSLEGTEEVRKINAEYAYLKPLELKQEHEKALYDWEADHDKQLLQYRQSLTTDQMNFEFELRREAFEGERARSKSLYLTNMSQFKNSIGISEQALQAIGSSTDSVLESVKELGAQLGTSLKEQISMAASAAGLGKLYQTSGTDVLKMSRNFRLMDKSSSKVAFNNIAGLSAFAELNQISPGELFKQMADASEEILKYSNMTTSQYANQAVLLSNMNTSMKDMAAASGTMVLNYKDSIKSEMSLSAMLGRNVNLSEVRARLMSGDMAGGASALKSALGGIDIGSMNAFQKQALSQSTGMGIEQLMELTQSKGGGAKGVLSERAGIKTGRDIAKGARDMDISTKASLMSMEQDQRLKMLEIEHEHRLEQIEKEEAWRVLWEIKYGKNQALDMNAANKLVESASGAATYASLNSQGAFADGAGFNAYGLNYNAANTGYNFTKSGYKLSSSTDLIRALNGGYNPNSGGTTTTTNSATTSVAAGGSDMYEMVKQGFNEMVKGWNLQNTNFGNLTSHVDTFHDNQLSRLNSAVNTLVTWVDTAHDNNLTEFNKQLSELYVVQVYANTELLRRTDVTNSLLDTLIEATVTTAAKPITIDGKRVNDVMKNVQTRVYGITGNASGT